MIDFFYSQKTCVSWYQKVFAQGDRICDVCRKIGKFMPEHFNNVRKWSKEVNGYIWTPSIVHLPIGIIYPEANEEN